MCDRHTCAYSRVDLGVGAMRYEHEVPLQRHARLFRFIHKDAEIHRVIWVLIDSRQVSEPVDVFPNVASKSSVTLI